MARDAAEREADQILPKSEVSKLWRRFRACCAHCVLDVPIDSGANGHNKYITSGGDSSGVCSGQNIYRVPVRLHTRRCFSSALATILYVVHGKPHHSMGDVFDSDFKVDLLQIASQLTQRGDPWAASSRIAPQFTTVTLRLNKMAGGIEANPKSQPTYAFWQADHHKMLTRCRHTKHSKTPRSR